MGYVACLGQIPEETAHVLQNLVSANGLGSQDIVKCFSCMYICSTPKLISVIYSFLSDTVVIVSTILFLI